ncbi:MAG: solute carrier family 23 protein [Tissierellia bacterium]|nr:solute carrier family 23 protein [Tissierellia bacterium]
MAAFLLENISFFIYNIAMEVKNRIEEKLNISKNISLSLTHVILMNAYVVPLVISMNANMKEASTAIFVARVLIASGLATFLMASFFVRYPLIFGASFLPVAASVSIIQNSGFNSFRSAFLIASIIFFILSLTKKFDRLIKYLLPGNMGAFIVIIIGFSLLPMGFTGQIFIENEFSIRENVILALITMISMFTFSILSNKKIKTASFFRVFGGIISIIIGAFVSFLIKEKDFSQVRNSSLISPIFEGFNFKIQTNFSEVFTILIILIVMITENTGSILVAQEETKVKIKEEKINSLFINWAFLNFISSLIYALPISIFTSNAGLIRMTDSYSRHIYKYAGIILILLGLSGKLMSLLSLIPTSVIGGIFVLISANIVINGIKMIDFKDFDEIDGLILAFSIIIAMALSMMDQKVLSNLPSILKNLLQSSIASTSILAIILNRILKSNNK